VDYLHCGVMVGEFASIAKMCQKSPRFDTSPGEAALGV
jgi:hypothetical protein